MLWYKAWRQTRWRFLVGLGLLLASACGVVIYYPEVMKLMPVAEGIQSDGAIGRQIREAVELSREYRGYIWTQWMRQSLVQLGTIFAVLLGTGGSLCQTSGAPVFTLALPVTRRQLIGSRAVTGLGEWLVLAFVPGLLIPVLSPTVGQSYAVTDILAHALCVFAAGATFYSFAYMLSNIFDDLWRPMLIAFVVAVALAFIEPLVFGLSRFTVYETMTGEFYFRTGQLPWQGLLICGLLSASMLYASAVIAERRDF